LGCGEDMALEHTCRLYTIDHSIALYGRCGPCTIDHISIEVSKTSCLNVFIYFHPAFSLGRWVGIYSTCIARKQHYHKVDSLASSWVAKQFFLPHTFFGVITFEFVAGSIPR